MASPDALTPLPATGWQDRDWSSDIHDAEIAGKGLRYLDMGEGAPLVLLHGTGGAWQSWLLNLEGLAQRHRVIAVDLPGFGQSDPLPPAPVMSGHRGPLARRGGRHALRLPAPRTDRIADPGRRRRNAAERAAAAVGRRIARRHQGP